MIFVPYLPVHLRGVILQETQRAEDALLTPDYCEMLFNAGLAWTGFHEGKFIGSAGIQDLGNKGHLWALLSEECKGPLMLAVTRKVKAELSATKFKRLEFYTRDSKAHRKWAKVLGFTLETPDGMAGYCHDGATAFMYSRVR